MRYCGCLLLSESKSALKFFASTTGKDEAPSYSIGPPVSIESHCGTIGEKSAMQYTIYLKETQDAASCILRAATNSLLNVSDTMKTGMAAGGQHVEISLESTFGIMLEEIAPLRQGARSEDARLRH